MSGPLRLLSEQEVDELIADGLLKIGQCHAVEDGIAPEDRRTPVLLLCEARRRPYKQTCERHRAVRGRGLLGALGPWREVREQAHAARKPKRGICPGCGKERAVGQFGMRLHGGRVACSGSWKRPVQA